MSNLDVLEREALLLSDSERATLAASLLRSLPEALADADDGIAEALRRDRDLETGSKSLSWEELARNLGRG